MPKIRSFTSLKIPKLNLTTLSSTPTSCQDWFSRGCQYFYLFFWKLSLMDRRMKAEFFSYDADHDAS